MWCHRYYDMDVFFLLSLRHLLQPKDFLQVGVDFSNSFYYFVVLEKREVNPK